MIKFSEYLIEAKTESSKKLDHIQHLEDHILDKGHPGVGLAAQHLDDVHNALTGKKNNTSISTKYDGSPSIVFGHHPENGAFFVGTKSVFNKTPKINYTPEDIEKNHGHSADLVDKLNHSLEHLKKITPESGGVYQGDLMYTKNSVERKSGNYKFKPNTIEYSTPTTSSHGKLIKNSKVGVVVHTKYEGKDLASMGSAPLDKDTRSSFRLDPDVHNIDPTVYPDPKHYSDEEQNLFKNHKESARLAYTKMDPAAMDAVYNHKDSLISHISKSIKKGEDPSVEGFVTHLNDGHLKEMGVLKSPSTKTLKKKAHEENVKHVLENSDHFKNVLDVHSNLQKAKNVLTKVLSRHTPFEHTIDGEIAGPEGAVVTDKKGNISKFIDRSEFSKKTLTGSSSIEKAKKDGK